MGFLPHRFSFLQTLELKSRKSGDFHKDTAEEIKMSSKTQANNEDKRTAEQRKGSVDQNQKNAKTDHQPEESQNHKKGAAQKKASKSSGRASPKSARS